MSEKKTKKAQEKASRQEKIVDAAMKLSAELGWSHFTMHDLADQSGMSLSELSELIDDKGDLIALLGKIIDRKVLDAFDRPDHSVSPRDQLFDILMERFDALNDYRAGVISLLSGFKFDPKQAVISCPHICKSMNWMLEAAGIETGGLRGAVKVAGLTGLYLKTLRVWKEDDSADMAKVMAALDKDLGRVEGIATRFSL